MRKGKRKLLVYSLLILFAMAFTWHSCTKQEESSDKVIAKVKDDILLSKDKVSKRFDLTIKKIRQKYPYEGELVMDTGFPSVSCGSDEDDQLECSDLVVTIPLPIPGTQEIYHPSLPPMDCGLECQMDVSFCVKPDGTGVIVFKNFKFIKFIYPISDFCIDWLNAYNQLPYPERAVVYQKLKDDYSEAYQLLFMQNWTSDPNNTFNPCPPNDGSCSSNDYANGSIYYKAACTKVCLVWSKDCDKDDEILGFFCQKEIPCYENGCCKIERGYCLDDDTGEVKICHEAIYSVGECTVPIPNDPCFIEMKSCGQSCGL